MPIGRCVRHCNEFLLSFTKVVRHQWAKIRQRAAGEDEGNCQGLTFELARADSLPEFVREMIFRQWVANLQRIDIPHEPKCAPSWQFVGIRRREFLNLIDPYVCLTHGHSKRD